MLDRAPYPEGLATSSLIHAMIPTVWTEDALVCTASGGMHDMHAVLSDIELAPAMNILQHYGAFWRLGTTDLSKHPCAKRGAILHTSSGMQIRTFLVHAGLTAPDSENKVKIVESTYSSTFLDVLAQFLWEVDDKPDPSDFQELHEEAAPFVVVVTRLDIAACAKRCRSKLQTLQPPISVPIIAISASDAKKMLAEMRTNKPRVLTCKLAIEPEDDHECSICGDAMDKVVQLPGCNKEITGDGTLD
jgi:hypothetical protein